MAESAVIYLNARPHHSLESLLERIFLGRVGQVNISTNRRVLKLDELRPQLENKDTLFIYEKAEQK